MLKILWSDCYIYINFFFLLTSSWYLFFKLNFFNALDFKQANDKVLIRYKKIKNLDFFIYLRFNIFILCLLFCTLYILKLPLPLGLWNHFKYSNFIIYIVEIIILINIIFLYIINTFSFNSEVIKSDFFFSLINLSIFLILLLFTNSFYSFFFVIEVNSLLLFYKFLTSRLWYKDSSSKRLEDQKNSKFNPRIFLNMLFFQFWSSFFSSIFFVYIIIYILYSFGSTEWSIVNYLNTIKYSNINYNYAVFYLIISLFLFSFFIKLGLTPIHLYKIEIYKGISYLSIFFYSTYYFFIFFFYFILIIISNLSSFYTYFFLLLLLLIIVGSVFIISLLFDINYIKAFFAYSSIVNSLNFLIITLSLIW